MPRHIRRDPTEFFSVVGAPYIRERSDRTHARRSSRFSPGAAIALVLGTVIAGLGLTAANGVAKLVEVAHYVKK